MRVVLQRVTNASVRVDGEVVGQIGKGLVCLVGITRDDTEEDAEFCCRRLLNARLWEDEKGTSWKSSVISNGYEVLLVSQFTLYGFFQGNKPDFHLAMAPAPAKEFYHAFCDRVRAAHSADKVAEGIFGAMMEVSLVNDGPVTMTIDSRDRKGSK
ncbi:hypothetical protein P43SY_002689 [Pythium insidiosum]|uniref:D-aminoacyl-tRNA deacylase n=1 Tax=Pythium insidiosum TaxID=114742 RepID=A0AAD5LV55_PYTIN|nr:hypothetical protein P43SY_002689 [Pythium insidiosum]